MSSAAAILNPPLTLTSHSVWGIRADSSTLPATFTRKLPTAFPQHCFSGSHSNDVPPPSSPSMSTEPSRASDFFKKDLASSGRSLSIFRRSPASLFCL